MRNNKLPQTVPMIGPIPSVCLIEFGLLGAREGVTVEGNRTDWEPGSVVCRCVVRGCVVEGNRGTVRLMVGKDWGSRCSVFVFAGEVVVRGDRRVPVELLVGTIRSEIIECSRRENTEAAEATADASSSIILLDGSRRRLASAGKWLNRLSNYSILRL